jgi:hypothetical protein
LMLLPINGRDFRGNAGNRQFHLREAAPCWCGLNAASAVPYYHDYDGFVAVTGDFLDLTLCSTPWSISPLIAAGGCGWCGGRLWAEWAPGRGINSMRSRSRNIPVSRIPAKVSCALPFCVVERLRCVYGPWLKVIGRAVRVVPSDRCMANSRVWAF